MPNPSNDQIVADFRASGGRVGPPFENSRLVLVTTTGERTGNPHTVPLGYLPDGERLLVLGSAAGSDRHPQWFRNLLAEPVATVEDGVFRYEARAVVLEGAERDAAFARAVETDPGWQDHQDRTHRVIPVVALEPAGPPTPTATSWGAALVGVHGALRRELALVRSEVAASGGTLGAQLRVNCLTVCAGLHTHHTMEDAGMLPALAAQHPDLAAVVDRLRAEHAGIAVLLERLQEVTGSGGGGEDVLAQVDVLVAEVERHLDYEEAHLLPVLDGAGA
ncbi:nitroreductase/quinone reductase family protein [Kineococcus glutinatus]|uniref:Nitroreductase/quinone reductase family protein n=1 Tax=Kineococcus glutinatus TaxID=1070872 RepID=A0ABP9HV32_9ACTN